MHRLFTDFSRETDACIPDSDDRTRNFSRPDSFQKKKQSTEFIKAPSKAMRFGGAFSLFCNIGSSEKYGRLPRTDGHFISKHVARNCRFLNILLLMTGCMVKTFSWKAVIFCTFRIKNHIHFLLCLGYNNGNDGGRKKKRRNSK